MMWLLTVLVLADSATTARIPVAPAESLAVTIRGAGPAIVFLPGPFGSGFAFRNVTAALAERGYQTIVVEPLGVGLSSRPKDADYSLTAQAERVGRTMDALQVTGALVVGHAVGASIAYRLALARPEHVRAILSIEGGPTESATTPGFRTVMRFAPMLKLLGVDLLRRRLRRGLMAATSDTTWLTEDVVDGYIAGADRDFGATVDAYKGMANSEEPYVLAERLPEIAIPVLVILGAVPHRSAPTAQEISLLGTSLPLVRIDTVPNVAHFPHEERPGVLVAALLRLEQMSVP
ncbi:MAG TPA: alpha/beta hydrolase [Gemmatimonadales bacterium]